MYNYEFCIPGLPKSTNVLRTRNHFINSKEANKWKDAIGIMVPFKERPLEPLRHVIIEITRYGRSMDYDNMVASFKPLLDGLTLCKIIAHDGPEIINHDTYVCRWIKHSNTNGFVKIRIQEQPLRDK